MVTVTVHGVTMSTCTQRVITMCNEIGIQYKIVDIDPLTQEHKSPEYIATKQPFGVFPVLFDEDGTQLFESRAICRYLVAKYGKASGLAPSSSDPRAYGLFEQAASIEYSNFDPFASPLARERIYIKLLAGRDCDEELAQKCIDTLNEKMEGYERILSKQKYLAGDSFTLADLFHLPTGNLLNQVEPKILHSKPSVKRWWDEISSRESWKAATTKS